MKNQKYQASHEFRQKAVVCKADYHLKHVDYGQK